MDEAGLELFRRLIAPLGGEVPQSARAVAPISHVIAPVAGLIAQFAVVIAMIGHAVTFVRGVVPPPARLIALVRRLVALVTRGIASFAGVVAIISDRRPTPVPVSRTLECQKKTVLRDQYPGSTA